MFGTLITTAASLLVASLVSGDTVVNLLLVGDSSIGQSDIGVVGGVVHGSIIGSDSTATTYEVHCALTTTVAFPLTTPACVTGDHVTITQGPHTALFSQSFITSGTTEQIQAGNTFANTNTVTFSITETTIKAGTSHVDSSSGVQTNPLIVPVTITAGANSANVTTTPTNTGVSSAPTTPSTSKSAGSTAAPTTADKPSLGVTLTVTKGEWALLLSVFVIAYFAL